MSSCIYESSIWPYTTLRLLWKQAWLALVCSQKLVFLAFFSTQKFAVVVCACVCSLGLELLLEQKNCGPVANLFHRGDWVKLMLEPGSVFTWTSWGGRVYSMASSSKILLSSHIKSDRRATFSPKFWWFIVCERPRESLSLPPSICMSDMVRPNAAFQWWGLLVMYLQDKGQRVC